MNLRRWRLAVGLLLAMSLCACGPARDGGSPAPTQTRPRPAAARWLPVPGASWQWQLSGVLDLEVDADIYDVDFETTTRAEAERLKHDGRRLICYLSVGSWENFRGDAGTFPPIVLGQIMDGWPDERWLDIRRLNVLLPIMAARMDACAAKGFDAVEPDNVDGYRNATGFPLTATDQLAYNRAIARLAHARGLSAALKNDVDQIPDLVHDFDFAVNEECVRYAECEAYTPFTDAGKAVLHVEYQGSLGFCADTRRSGFSSMRKPVDLGPARRSC